MKKNKKVKVQLLKDINLSNFYKEAEEIEAKIAGQELSKTELEIIHAHADKMKAEIEALEKELQRELSADELGTATGKDYAEALRAIYEGRLKDSSTYKIARGLLLEMDKGKVERVEDVVELLHPKLKLLLPKEKTELKEIKTGVTLATAEQNNLVLTLARLRDESYRGKIEPEKVVKALGYESVKPLARYGYLDHQYTPTDMIVITPYELDKAYRGEVDGGGGVQSTINMLYDIARVNHLLLGRSETKRAKNSKGNEIYQEVEEQTLAKLLEVRSFTVRDREIVEDVDEIIDESTVLAIVLNPLFVRRIDENHFALLPNDINNRMKAATGKGRISLLLPRLINHLALQQSFKNLTYTIKVDTLQRRLAKEKYEEGVRDRQVKSTALQIQKAIAQCKEMGLLKSYKFSTNKQGEKVITFYIFEKWQKTIKCK